MKLKGHLRGSLGSRPGRRARRHGEPLPAPALSMIPHYRLDPEWIDAKPPGKTPKLNAVQRQALVQVIESGPVPALHGALAPGGPGAMGLGGVPHPDQPCSNV